MQVLCRSCRAPIPGENVNIQNMIAKCDECHAVFGVTAADVPMGPPGALGGAARAEGGLPLPSALQGGAARVSGGLPLPLGMHGGGWGYQPVERGRVAMPGGMSVEDDGKDLLIRRGWFEWTSFLFLGFVIIWDGFAVGFVWDGNLLNDLAGGGGFFAFIPLVMLVIGVGAGYCCLGSFVNSTTIRIGHDELAVSHGPLPWAGNYVYPRSEVAQLYCVEQIHRGKKGNVSYTYDVEIVLRNNLRQPLLTGLTDITQALFVEQEVERHFDLTDAPVAGEVRRW